MRNMILILLLALSSAAYGGQANCTGVTHVTASGNYNASGSDCIISVDKDYFDFTWVNLPDSPSLDDEFTIKENTSSPACDDYGCWPAGTGVQSVNSNTLLDESQGVILSDFHQYVRLIWNGSQWVGSYGYF